MFSGACAHTTPVFNEFYPLRQLQRNDLLGQNDLVVNGQSGDFITGGHIHPTAALDRDGLAHYTWRKHFALIESDSAKFGLAGVEALLADWRADYSSGLGWSEEHAAVSDYLAFEWQERQSRYVVDQHRAYDFLGLRWSTPLWDNDLVDLYDSVPFEFQFKQKLYIEYLKDWNYRGLFEKLRLPYDPWPRLRLADAILDRIVHNAYRIELIKILPGSMAQYVCLLSYQVCAVCFNPKLYTSAAITVATFAHGMPEASKRLGCWPLVRCRNISDQEPTFPVDV